MVAEATVHNTREPMQQTFINVKHITHAVTCFSNYYFVADM